MIDARTGSARQAAAAMSREELLGRVLAGVLAVEPERLILSDRIVPITRGIVRFRNDDGYNASFARQWRQFAREQIDHANGTNLTRERFLRETGWRLDDLRA